MKTIRKTNSQIILQYSGPLCYYIQFLGGQPPNPLGPLRGFWVEGEQRFALFQKAILV
jgi:hypothetical protein